MIDTHEQCLQCDGARKSLGTDKGFDQCCASAVYGTVHGYTVRYGYTEWNSNYTDFGP